MTTRFRNMLKEPFTIVMPGVYDALSAKIAESVGFTIVANSGGFATAVWGYPIWGLYHWGKYVTG